MYGMLTVPSSEIGNRSVKDLLKELIDGIIQHDRLQRTYLHSGLVRRVTENLLQNI